MRSVLVPLLGAALLLGCVPQESRSPAARSDGESGMAAVRDSATVEELLAELAAANAGGLEAAGVAAERAVDPAVRELARTLAADHERARARLQWLAAEMGLPPPEPPEGNALGGLEGVELDRAFVRGQIEAHRSGINAIQNHLLAAARGERVRQYLEETLTAMRAHLASLEEVRARLPRTQAGA